MIDPSRRDFLRSAGAAFALAATRGVMPFSAAIPLCKSVSPIACCELNGVPTGGTYVISANGRSSAPIPWDATIETIERAINKLVPIDWRGAS
jgi:hypothetical protein